MGETRLIKMWGRVIRMSKAASTLRRNCSGVCPCLQESLHRSEWPAAMVTSFQCSFMLIVSDKVSNLLTKSSAWSARSWLVASLPPRLSPLRVNVPVEVPFNAGLNCRSKFGTVVKLLQSPAPPMAKETSG